MATVIHGLVVGLFVGILLGMLIEDQWDIIKRKDKIRTKKK